MRSPPPIALREADGPWVRWRSTLGAGAAGRTSALQAFRLGTFRLLAALAAGGLVLLIVRTLLVGRPFPWADTANAVFFGLLLAASFWRPDWLKLLSWFGLLSLFLNAMDAMRMALAGSGVAFLVLLPLLIVYGALLGDLWLSLAAATGVAIIYVVTFLRLPAETHNSLMLLTNLGVLTLLSGAASISVWLRHRRLLRQLDLQADVLRRELDAHLHLHALVVHDIANPLAVLMQSTTWDDPPTVREMARRIQAIIISARRLHRVSPGGFRRVTVAEVNAYLGEVFTRTLARKKQTLEVAGPQDLVVATDLPMLCNSVLGNALANAAKYSARGAALRLVASVEGQCVRLSVEDAGPGFPDEMLQRGAGEWHGRSSPGTEGEPGSGYGLAIAALCAERLGGRLEIRNRAGGGASVAVILPRAEPPVPAR